MIVYHASLDDFKVFKVTEQGIHFGSKESALIAVERKAEQIAELHGISKYPKSFYLYKVELDVSSFVDEFDQGYDWAKSFEKEIDSIKGYVYNNKYEPSTKPSYITWDLDTIKIIDKRELEFDHGIRA